jgi:hypothetical protein
VFVGENHKEVLGIDLEQSVFALAENLARSSFINSEVMYLRKKSRGLLWRSETPFLVGYKLAM